MIVRKSLDWRIVFRVAWKRLAAIAFLCVAVKLAGVSPGEPLVAAVSLIEGILGTAVSILMGFRVNAAYDRWWEGQRIWGSLVSESRTFACQVLSLLSEHFHPERDGETVDGSRRELVLGQVGLAVALKNHLRQMPEVQQAELEPWQPEALMQSRGPGFKTRRRQWRQADAHEVRQQKQHQQQAGEGARHPASAGCREINQASAGAPLSWPRRPARSR